jgi:hypothetical protein
MRVLLRSSIVPFLTATYSRAYEYTCDNIGGSFIADKTGKLQGFFCSLEEKTYISARSKTRLVLTGWSRWLMQFLGLKSPSLKSCETALFRGCCSKT